MSNWLKLYHQLPYPLQNLGASLRGAYLQAWRYGPETESLIEEILDQESWSAAQWKLWQDERLSHILERAVAHVPYYRQYWEMRRRQEDRASWHYLENWPVLEKDDLRANPLAFVADDVNANHMFHEHTSGTTGKSLDLWWSLKTVRIFYALFEARYRRWHGVSRQDCWGILGGQLITPVKRRKPPFWVWNAPMNQLYLSSYHLSPDLIPAYLDALVKYKVVYLWGYTSSLYTLAIEVLRLKRRDIQFKIIITNAEPVYDYQRQAIEEAFQCPVRATYGMAEIVTAASECECGRLHSWPEVGIIEILQVGQSLSLGVSGDLVGTGLLNEDMPLIRYRVGDIATLPIKEISCACHRTLPIIDSIEGRSDDVLFTAEGRRVGRLDPIFKENLPVYEAQIIQETIDRVRICYVPAVGFSEKDSCSLVERLQARLGSVTVILEPVSQIPREANGKFRAVISLLKDKPLNK
jgi:phenylacetate-CoA ligase